MNLAELIRRTREHADDTREPYWWSDSSITDWLNDAAMEAAIRKRLLHEAENPLLCQISVAAGEAIYKLHPAMYELTYVAFRSVICPRHTQLKLVSKEWLDARMPDWRERCDMPEFAIQDGKTLRLAPVPRHAGHVVLEGYRIPLRRMCDEKDEPEIHPLHHVQLIQWALHRGYRMPDVEPFDPERSRDAEAEFTAYFGRRPDADLRRETREDVTHHVEAILP